jgi:hypothetical protein
MGEYLMKLKKEFVLKEIAGECIVVSVNSDLDLGGVMMLNSTAKTLWQALEDGVESVDELVKALTDEYEVTEQQARSSVEKFLDKLKELNLLA